ncbi:DoxX family membrane protein [bacterium]|nr:DoxX family membrane protein [bacterium]
MEKVEYFDWMLLGVRLFVGAAFVIHGIQKTTEVIAYLPSQETFSLFFSSNSSFLFICLAPLIEIIGGGLILSGIIIELGTILVVPATLIIFFIANLQNSFFIPETNVKFVFNFISLAITIGFCGPGKWALWDPRKSARGKIF